MVNLGQQPGYRGLARAGIAHKHQVQGHGGHRQPRLLAQLAHFHQVDKPLHVLLHLVQPAQLIQLGQQLLQRGLRLSRGLVLLACGLRLGRRGGHRLILRLSRFDGGAVGAAGHKLVHVQPAFSPLHPAVVAVGGQGIGADIDKPRLRLAHLAVHRGE